jgi:Carboxypeptidase regulatory-like domain
LLFPTHLAAQATGGAVFAGTVVDSLQHPLADAEVSLPGLAISRLTDANGNFRLTGLAGGTQRVVVRRIGYGQLDTSIVLVDSQTVLRRVTLGRIVHLDSVVVKAVNLDLDMTNFEEHRKLGFGRFLTRDQLAKVEGTSLAAATSGLQGLAFLRGSGGQSWVVSKRAVPTRCTSTRAALGYRDAVAAQRATDECLRSERVYYVPEGFETRSGVQRACYALVYLDRSPLNAAHPTMPFDINTFLPSQIESVEWYETDAQVPEPYPAADARCGLLVLHKRRSG